ncbi:hypothetical protein [Lysobacter hankyongensis]|uniref:Uncharacterized protein n=1 Tax=Lysobacter hankyongensis TaxID=1176535 RepID=A0ABP9B4U1_9GAMM
MAKADWYPIDTGDHGPPPLSEWLMRTFQRMHRKGLMTMAAAKLHVSEPTLRKGGPSRPAAQRRMIDRFRSHIAKGIDGTDERYRQHIDALDARIERGHSFDFSAAFARHDDPRIVDICAGIDNINTAMLLRRMPASEADDLFRTIAGRPGVFPRPAILSPAVDAVALNAMLMLLALMDHALRRQYDDSSVRPRPVFLGLTPKPAVGRVRYRSPTRRYLDHLYGWAHLFRTWERSGKALLPATLPTLAKIDAAFGLQEASGIRSRAVYWRDNSKALYLADVDEIMGCAFGQYVDGMRPLCFDYYFAAMFWEAVKEHAPERLDWAVDRYREWWEISLADDPEAGELPDPYWCLV